MVPNRCCQTSSFLLNQHQQQQIPKGVVLQGKPKVVIRMDEYQHYKVFPARWVVNLALRGPASIA